MLIKLDTSYKAFRNFIRKLDFDDSMYVIWAYFNLITLNNFKLPEDIESPPSDIFRRPLMISIQPWKLLRITDEILLRKKELKKEKSLKTWGSLANCLNKLETINGVIAQNFISEENIKNEIFRTAHLQFPWQETAPNIPELSRYYLIYEKVKTFFEEYYEIPIKHFYFLGLAIYTKFTKYPAIKLPVEVLLKDISNEHLNKLLKSISLPASEFPKEILQKQKLDESFFSAFSPLQSYPLIIEKFRGEECLICPSSYLLFQRLTTGIYYDLISKFGHGEFGNAFGEAFESYVGELVHTANKNKKFTILDDSSDRSAHTVDWVLSDSTTRLFIECKTQRATLDVKQELDLTKSKEKLLESISKHIVQGYLSIQRYLDGEYPNLKCSKDIENIYLVVVYLENLYVFGFEGDELKNKVRHRFKINGISEDMLDKYPYVISSVREMESALQVLQKVDMNEFFHKKINDSEMKKWALSSYMNNCYKEESKENVALFNIFTSKLRAEDIK